MTSWTPSCRAGLVAAALLIVALWPAVAWADAPGTRGDDEAPQGGTAAAPAWPLAPQQAPQAAGDLPWLQRDLTTGLWVLDAGLGIGGGALGTVNEALRVAWEALAGALTGAAGGAACDGPLGFVLCTPPELFFEGGAQRPLATVIAVVWRALTPAALSLVTLLFLLRIGRLLAEGPSSLAEDGKALVISFVGAMLFIGGARPLLRLLIDAQNGLHELMTASAAGAIGAVLLHPPETLNIGAHLAQLLLGLLAFAMLIKALIRAVHLAILISVAPLMGALLIDRATSPRFGAWLARLLDVLLQQTAWVFFFWIGGLMFRFTADAADVPGQVAGAATAAVVLGMALGGEAALAGIAGVGRTPGWSAGSAAARRATHAATRLLLRQPGTSSAPPVASSPLAATGDPAQSAAARRATRR